jgi:hypothetical protein
MKQGLSLYFALMVYFNGFCNAQISKPSIIEIHNEKGKNYSYIPLSNCFINLPNGFRPHNDYALTNDSGSISIGVDDRFEIPFNDNVLTISEECEGIKENFIINGFNAVLYTCEGEGYYTMRLAIGKENFSTMIRVNCQNDSSKVVLRNALLSIYPDAKFKRRKPQEHFGSNKLKKTPGFKSGEPGEYGGETLYSTCIDSTVCLIGIVRYYNMFFSFDTTIKYRLNSIEAFNREYPYPIYSIINMKMGKVNGNKLFEYDEIYNDKEIINGKYEKSDKIMYHAIMTRNFKIVELFSGKYLNKENYFAYKKAFQNAIKKIVID